MRICLVGNSHLGAFKVGWDRIGSEYPDIELTFFGAPASAFKDTAVENGRLVPKTERARKFFLATSGGRDALVPGDYDLIVLVALRYEFGVVLDVYARYRGDDQNHREGDFTPVSPAYFNELVRYRLVRSPALVYRRMILDACGEPRPHVWIHPTPLPGIAALGMSNPKVESDLERRRFANLQQAAQSGDEEALYAAVAFARADLEREKIYVFEQLAETRTRAIFTRREYWDGALHFWMEHGVDPEADFSHMNGDYGALALRQIFARAHSSLRTEKAPQS